MVQRPFPILDWQGPFVLGPLPPSQILDFHTGLSERFIVRKGAFGAPEDAVCDWKRGASCTARSARRCVQIGFRLVVLTPSLGFALRASLRLSKLAPGQFVGRIIEEHVKRPIRPRRRLRSVPWRWTCEKISTVGSRDPVARLFPSLS